MTSLYSSCFDYAFRYTYFAFLPPFVSASRYYLGYLSVFNYLFLLIRAILTVTEEGKKDFEICYMITVTAQIGANAFIYVLQYKSFGRFEGKINEFLKDNESNFVNDDGPKFIEVWNASKPVNFAKVNFWYFIFAGSVWLLILDYNLLYFVEKSTDSPFPYYSPFINWGGNYKWIHIIMDTVVMLHVLCIAVQADIVLISFLKFLNSQLVYLRLLLEDLMKRKGNDEMNKIWISKHCMVLNLAKEMNELLKPHIMMKYLGLVLPIIFDMLMLTQKDSKMNFVQKVIELLVVAMMFVVMGYECSIVEKLSETHGSMYDCLLKEDVIKGDRKQIYFLKMLILRCQKPIRISDYGFFIMDIRHFRTVLVRTYEFYSSIVSINKKQLRKLQ